MTKTQATDFLHKKGYSRRMSAKLADIAFITKGNTVFEQAVKDALEKARTKGAKDVKKRKKRFSKYGTDVSKKERRWRSKIKPIVPWNEFDKRVKTYYNKELGRRVTIPGD